MIMTQMYQQIKRSKVNGQQSHPVELNPPSAHHLGQNGARSHFFCLFLTHSTTLLGMLCFHGNTHPKVTVYTLIVDVSTDSCAAIHRHMFVRTCTATFETPSAAEVCTADTRRVTTPSKSPVAKLHLIGIRCKCLLAKAAWQ